MNLASGGAASVMQHDSEPNAARVRRERERDGSHSLWLRSCSRTRITLSAHKLIRAHSRGSHRVTVSDGDDFLLRAGRFGKCFGSMGSSVNSRRGLLDYICVADRGFRMLFLEVMVERSL